MILVIRISGMIKIPKKVDEALYRMRLRRKYSAVLLEDSSENLKLLRRVRDYVAYGKIDEKMLSKLIELRGQPIDKNKKIDSKKIVSGLDKNNLDKFGLKPFFRLHPPRKGIESKKHFGVGKGVLGDNKEKINELLERML
tara:strand:+ start:516 stop:935 length:420 start_codon:yes stop_codon:yes gene_type:complete